MNDNDYDEDTQDPTSPLPLMDGGRKVGGLSYKCSKGFYPYVIRFTPENKFGMESIMEDFLQPNFDTWIVSKETKPIIHYHIYLESTLPLDKLKVIEKKFVYSFFVDRSRGFGTKQHSCLLSDNPLNAIIYLLKQRGEFYYSGFTDEFIAKCQAQSFEKSTNVLATEMLKLEERFMTENIEPIDYAEMIVLLYAKHDKILNFQNIQNYVYSKIVKRDPSRAKSMIKKYMQL